MGRGDIDIVRIGTQTFVSVVPCKFIQCVFNSVMHKSFSYVKLHVLSWTCWSLVYVEQFGE